VTTRLFLDVLGQRPLLTRKDLARHFVVCVLTIDRWHANGYLPKAIYVRGPRWRPDDIDRLDRKRKEKA
jgi:hypothetical protein